MSQSEEHLRKLKEQKLKMMEAELERKEGLPHLYARKKYPWQVKFKAAKFHKMRFVCAANQIGKSTIQIEDELEIGYSPELWPELWPTQFKLNPKARPYSWYLYPNQDTVTDEVENKWEVEILPRGKYKDDPVYGWKKVIKNKVIKYIELNTGYRIYFKTYNQAVTDLQSGTVWRINCDEELPETLLSELQARMFATDGQFSMAFTATTGQEIWYDTIEEIGTDRERFKEAFKIQVSMYDCLYYEDGTQGPWTISRIKAKEARCKSKAEIDRRIKGRFALDKGLKYTGFTREKNYKRFPEVNGKMFKGVPKGWSVYGGIDFGSGGDDNHPSAYGFISVNPEQTKLRIFKCKRLDGITTTQPDTYAHYKRDRGKMDMTAQCYDWAAVDFGIMAERIGDPFNKAKKNHETGEACLNAVLKLGILQIYYDPSDEDDQSIKLVREFETSLVGENKRTAKDDLIDFARYTLQEIPLDWEKILEEAAGEVHIETKEKPKAGTAEAERERDFYENPRDKEILNDECEQELTEWAGLY